MKQLVRSTVESREDGHMLAARLLACACCGLGLPTSASVITTVKTIPYSMSTGQHDTDKPSLRFSSQMILACGKLTPNLPCFTW